MTDMRRIAVEPITEAAFAPWGVVLAAPAHGPRQDRAGLLESTRPGARANLALIRSEPAEAAMPLRRLERHPHSSQAFLPLAVGAYLLVVAPDAGGRPDEAALRAFRVPGDAGIEYRRGAWHANMMTAGEPGVFAMLVHEDGSAGDCVFADIEPVALAED